jgi:hypothetical protein
VLFKFLKVIQKVGKSSRDDFLLSRKTVIILLSFRVLYELFLQFCCLVASENQKQTFYSISKEANDCTFADFFHPHCSSRGVSYMERVQLAFSVV